MYAAGAHATPGAGLPFVGLSAALVAQAVGPAREPRQTVMFSAAKISQRRLGAVQRVEVQAGRAAGQQLLAELGGDRDALGAHGDRVAVVGRDPVHDLGGHVARRTARPSA